MKRSNEALSLELRSISVLGYPGTSLSTGSRAEKPPRKFFNSASIGKCADDAIQEVTSAERKEDRNWDALRDEVRSKFASLLVTSIDHVELYYNTTAAIQRVFQVALAHSSSYAGPLLTTDEEYPGIAALVDESWPGSVFMARVSKAIWTGKGDTVERILFDACRMIRPSVIYLSHVTRYSGFCLPASTIQGLRQLNPRTLIIIDGAQAVGNVAVRNEILENSDFYITSGHKWLGGEPTLGLVYASRWAKLVADPAQSYSRKTGSGGTGSLRALVSLSKALDEFLLPSKKSCDWNPTLRMQAIADHNRSLAELFIQVLSNHSLDSGRRLYPILFTDRRHNKPELRSGIVVVARVPPAAVAALDDAEFEFTILKAEPLRDSAEGIVPSGRRYLIDLPPGADSVPRLKSLTLPETRWPHYAQHDSVCLRFCFHHFHSSRDVIALAGKLLAAVKGLSISKNKRRINAIRREAAKGKKSAT